ncbi:hypothetical protein [Pseudomonas sp. MWU12-2323]|uniref:hypothetical protein n=1 Tax=Pseudomonas sp. MWU12-2323 TaxID=2651296 RepID=UPI00128C7395|nr:hypothetical protein [Pseudomonas sp. MWU12-2323]MPQ71446.1 hypothetical protein [Pseudomonas sp. MWU12-2323]
MRIFENSHSSIGEHIIEQVANAAVHSATYHVVGALMRGHGLVMIVLIAIAIIAGVWIYRRSV